jgi:hypothetical protein
MKTIYGTERKLDTSTIPTTNILETSQHIPEIFNLYHVGTRDLNPHTMGLLAAL